jgi:hypothetical protein
MDTAELQDLGYMNSWDKTPDIVKQCRHERHHAEVRNCVTEVWCEECKFTFKIDSGD